MLALIVAAGIPVFVNRTEYDSAFSKWYRTRTPDNAAVLDMEMQKNRQEMLRVEIAAGVVVFLSLNGCWFLVRRLTR